MELTQFRYVYFLGIGGIGMSALARWFNVNGFTVAGYDKTPTALTDALQTEGMAVHFEDDIAHIPAQFRENPAETLVILTPAIPKDHQEWAFFQDGRYVIQKRSQVLGLLAGQMTTVAVAGTHGKTTTSSMVAHVLRSAGVNCAAFLGGITQNYGTNFLLNDPAENLRDVVCVVEADEFDRSFLTLFPQVAIVTSTDADHLDIYGDRSALLESFGQFVSQIQPGGRLLQRSDLGLENNVAPGVTVQPYARTEGDYHADALRIENAEFIFDIVYPEGRIADVRLGLPGFHNVENAVAAAGAALAVGVSPEKIREGLTTYRGVKRRFEYHLKTPRYVLIDDYAHHPTEVRAFLESVRALYPGRKITAIFQPHLFSRTADFAPEFAESLSLADTVLLLPIYPARELPRPGVTSELIFKDVTTAKRHVTPADFPDVLTDVGADVVVTIGAGDVDRLLSPLKSWLQVQQ